ncbi:MAG: TetR/AcrR family transcriptional regulator [Bacillota bacterium]
MGIRERIIRACRELSVSRGFSGVTIDELAAQAGVSKRTVYRYFASKDEIIEAAIDDFMATMEKQLRAIVSTEMKPAEMLSALLTRLTEEGRFLLGVPALADLQQRYPHLWRKIDEFRLSRFQYMLDVIRQRSNSQLIQETDPRITAAIIIAVIQAVVNPEFILRNGLTFEETIRQVSRFIMAIIEQNTSDN